MKTSKRCNFNEAWIGKCENAVPCEKHKDLVCCSCGEPATRSCPETGQFVCGMPLCNDCEHTIFPDGFNGGVGFNMLPCPPDMKRHTKKTGQKYKPYYLREE